MEKKGQFFQWLHFLHNKYKQHSVQLGQKKVQLCSNPLFTADPKVSSTDMPCMHSQSLFFPFYESLDRPPHPIMSYDWLTMLKLLFCRTKFTIWFYTRIIFCLLALFERFSWVCRIKPPCKNYVWNFYNGGCHERFLEEHIVSIGWFVEIIQEKHEQPAR